TPGGTQASVVTSPRPRSSASARATISRTTTSGTGGRARFVMFTPSLARRSISPDAPSVLQEPGEHVAQGVEEHGRADAAAPRSKPSEDQRRKEHREPLRRGHRREVEHGEERRLEQQHPGVDAEKAWRGGPPIREPRLNPTAEERLLGEGGHDQLGQRELAEVLRNAPAEGRRRLVVEPKADREEREDEQREPDRDGALAQGARGGVAKGAAEIEEPERSWGALVIGIGRREDAGEVDPE